MLLQKEKNLTLPGMTPRPASPQLVDFKNTVYIATYLGVWF
jgi:hypothetical protein